MMTIEEHRHQCFIRWILNLQATEGKKAGAAFLARLEKRHGQEYADRIRKDCRDQWAKGNRGQKDDWR
jgi:hypothetical protein